MKTQLEHVGCIQSWQHPIFSIIKTEAHNVRGLKKDIKALLPTRGWVADIQEQEHITRNKGSFSVIAQQKDY